MNVQIARNPLRTLSEINSKYHSELFAVFLFVAGEVWVSIGMNLIEYEALTFTFYLLSALLTVSFLAIWFLENLEMAATLVAISAILFTVWVGGGILTTATGRPIIGFVAWFAVPIMFYYLDRRGVIL